MKCIYKFIVIMIVEISHPSYSQLISGDTALLMELVTTTASQLNELEKLVSNADKYTQKMQQYNEIVQDQYFKAERSIYLAESLAAKKDINELGDLNSSISELKMNFEEIKVLMKEYDQIKHNEEKTKAKTSRLQKLEDRKDQLAKNQILKTANSKSVGRSNQLTAQNTALMYEAQVDSHKTQLEILENSATTNRLLSEDLKIKREEEAKKLQTYPKGSR